MPQTLYNLWYPDPNRTNPLPEIDLTNVDLENLAQKMLEQQQTCPHLNIQRWGPSYTARPDGSDHKTDGYICNDCGLSSERPIR
tara:strand:+ start:2131 stop:2382 length:252 start_codon:yes stop_codon:yes gene_type:complete